MVVQNLNIPQFRLGLEEGISARKALRGLPRQPPTNASKCIEYVLLAKHGRCPAQPEDRDLVVFMKALARSTTVSPA